MRREHVVESHECDPLGDRRRHQVVLEVFNVRNFVRVYADKLVGNDQIVVDVGHEHQLDQVRDALVVALLQIGTQIAPQLDEKRQENGLYFPRILEAVDRVEQVSNRPQSPLRIRVNLVIKLRIDGLKVSIRKRF